MNNRYELTLIINPNESEESAGKIVDKVVKAVTDNKGKMVEQVTWGIKEFAGPINKIKKGYYYFVQFDMDPEFVSKVTWVYRYEKAILRFLLVNLTTDKTYFKQIKLNKIKEKTRKEEERKKIIADASRGTQIDINMGLAAKEASKTSKEVEKKQDKVEEPKDKTEEVKNEVPKEKVEEPVVKKEEPKKDGEEG